MLGGGRYDGLIDELGGPPTAGVGWAGGIERLAMLMNEPAGAAAAGGDRAAGRGGRGQGARHRSRAAPRRHRRRARLSRQHEAAHAAGQQAQRPRRRILGDDELARGVAQLKDLDSGEQREVALDALAGRLR